MTDPPSHAPEPLTSRERTLALLDELPLPLAQLSRRALDGKSAVERHNCAYYLGEASLKLAAAARIRLYLERALEPEGNVARRLVCLKLPSLGQWCELLRSTNNELGAMVDADEVALARRARELGKRPDSWDAVVRLADGVVDAGVLNREIARRAVTGGPLGFFELLTAYRNEVIGHGAQRSDAYCDEFSTLLLDAVLDVLASDALFDGMRLGRAVASSDSPDMLVWQDLSGLAATTSSVDAGDVDPTQLYFRGMGEAISVHPLVVVRDDDLGREQVGFLNRTLLRTRTIAHGLVEEVRRVDYLDYATGDTFSGIDTREGMRELLERSRQADDEGAGDQLVALPIAHGSVVGDFEVRAPIGRGAAGVVFAAKQRSMDRIVALKVLEPSLVATSLQLRRFHREIAALARCDHANVVKVLTAGVDHHRHFYAMEFVDGADLARVGRVLAAWRRDGVELLEGHLSAAVRLAQRIQGGMDAPDSPAVPTGPESSDASPPEAEGRAIELRIAELFADAAEGLHHLHERGTVHRDVKPGNLMLTGDGSRMVVMDLGSAHLVDETATMTRSGMGLAGTLRYMAPEQLERQRDAIDGRADVYALGATLFELVTGRRMFDGDNEGRIVQQVLGERPPPVRSLVRSAPRSLEAVIARATSKHPDARYPTARALAEDLRAVAAALPTKAKPAGPMRRALSFAARHRVAVGAAAGLVAMASGSGALAWHWLQPHDASYLRCVEQRGAFVGLGEIDAVEGRSQACVVTRRADRVQRVVFVNGLGEPLENEDGDAILELVYAEGGELLERIHRRRDDTIRQKHRFAWEGNTLHATVVDRNNFRVSLDGSEVSSYRVSFDERGYPSRRLFFNDRGLPRRNAEWVFGYAVETDGRGLILQSTALDASGQPSADQHGVTTVAWKYADNGVAVERRNLDGKGALVGDREGIAMQRWTADERGNRSSEQRFDASSKPRRGQDGCSGFRASYDRAGAVVAWTCLGIDGAPDWHRDGYVTRRAAFDGRGNRVEETYLDTQGEPTLHRDGYAKWTSAYDERGYRIEQRFFDESGKPCEHRDGYALWRAEHDDAGHLVAVAYFDVNSKPTLHRDGVASWRSTYDLLGNLLSSAYFGKEGEPVLNRYGYARRSWRHDDRGDIVELAYYDVGGDFRESADGYARLQAQYDDRGRRVEQRYLDASGAPTRDTRDRVFGVRMTHDEQGRVVGREMLGSDGRPAPNPDGLLKEELTYDVLHRVVLRRFLGAQGEVLGETRGDHEASGEVSSRLGALRAAHPELFHGAGGLVVAGAFRGGEAAPSIRPGDVLVSLGGTAVFDERDVWFQERQTQEPVDAVLIRGKRQLQVRIEPTELARMLSQP